MIHLKCTIPENPSIEKDFEIDDLVKNLSLAITMTKILGGFKKNADHYSFLISSEALKFGKMIPEYNDSALKKGGKSFNSDNDSKATTTSFLLASVEYVCSDKNSSKKNKDQKPETTKKKTDAQATNTSQSLTSAKNICSGKTITTVKMHFQDTHDEELILSIGSLGTIFSNYILRLFSNQ